MKIGLFTEFSYPGKSERQIYDELLEQITLADELGYDFFSTTESFGKDVISCSPFPLGLYVSAAQRARRIRFLTGILSVPIHHPVILASQIAAATTPQSATFAGRIGQGLVQPGYLGIPLGLVRDLATVYRQNLPPGRSSDIILGVHLHAAEDREEAVRNGALALASQGKVFLESSRHRQSTSGLKEGYETKSESRKAFEKLCEPEKARRAVEAEAPNIMAVWGTPDESLKRIGYYMDCIQPEQLMLNIASGSLSQEKVVASM